ncbi:hypothetical protein ABE527_17165 [Brucella sp. TWI432]
MMSAIKSARGRPRREITRTQIADAGIAMGLPKISIVGVAAALSLSHMTLYTYVSSLDELKQLVASEIFLRWQLPAPHDEPLEEYMETFGACMWHFVERHPGIAPYLLREDLITSDMISKIQNHQKLLVQSYNLTNEQAQWLFQTVAHVCVSVADTLIPKEEMNQNSAHRENSEIKNKYTLGVKALIIGSLSMISEN